MARRKAVVAAVTVVVAAAAVVAAPAQATTAFTISGTQFFHPPPYPDDLLPGYFAGDTVTRIHYPAAIFGMDASIAIAADSLASSVDASTGPVVVAGFSQGAVAVTYEKNLLMSRPADQRPAPDRLTFLTVGDPSGPGGIMRFLPFAVPLIGLTPVAAPETPYDTVFVTGEYDGWSDFPDRPWNLLSMANALLGTVYVHGRYETVPGGLDLSAVPAQNITVTTNSLGATTTSYLIPTEKLPLLQPLRDIGIPEPIVVALETPLKQIVDSGYARNDAKPSAVQLFSVDRSPSRRAAVTQAPAIRPKPTASTPHRRAAARRAAVA